MILVSLVALVGCSGGGGEGHGLPGGLSLQAAAGDWQGQWNNTTSETSGDAEFAITVNPANNTATITVTLSGPVLGGTAPGPLVFTGAYDGTDFALNSNDTAFGDLEVTWTEGGEISGSLTNLPNPSVSRVDFSGSATSKGISVDYLVTSTAGGTAEGSVRLAEA